MQEEAEETGERNTSDSTNITAEGNLVFRWLGEEHWPALESCLFCLFFFICLSRLCEAKNYYNSTHD